LLDMKIEIAINLLVTYMLHLAFAHLIQDKEKDEVE
jgi:hypothetical protein